jgi:hypothetical protein
MIPEPYVRTGKKMAVSLFFLGIVDLLSTLAFLQLGGKEGNPLMAGLFNNGHLLAGSLVKIGLTVVFTYAIYLGFEASRTDTKKQFKRKYTIISFITILYFLGCFSNIIFGVIFP